MLRSAASAHSCCCSLSTAGSCSPGASTNMGSPVKYSRPSSSKGIMLLPAAHKQGLAHKTPQSFSDLMLNTLHSAYWPKTSPCKHCSMRVAVSLCEMHNVLVVVRRIWENDHLQLATSRQTVRLSAAAAAADASTPCQGCGVGDGSSRVKGLLVVSTC